jgi:hypothetical protein
MKKLRRSHHLVLCALAAALLLLVVAPGALAAETVAESPGGPTEPTSPEVSTPPPTGWIPQGSGTETSGGGGSSLHHGSSLGSGGRSTPVAPTSEEPSYSGGSSNYYPTTESSTPSTPSTTEEPTNSYGSTAEVDPVEPAPVKKTPAPKGGVAAVGAADAVSQPEVLRVAGVHAESPAKAVPLATQGDHVDTGLLWWLAIVVCSAIVIYAGARLLLEPTEPFKRGPGRRRGPRGLGP